MEDLRAEVLRINQIEQQLAVLKALQERKLSSSELQNLMEKLGIDHELTLPILKRTNLLKIQKIESSRQFWYWIPNNGNGHKEEKPLKVVLSNDKSVQVDRKKIKRTRNKTTDTRI
jgi:hypothetical protein